MTAYISNCLIWFQSSCEATGLRNGVLGFLGANLTIVSILLRSNGVAQRGISYVTRQRHPVSILLRSNGVAQRQNHRPPLLANFRFNPLAKQRGCATLTQRRDRNVPECFNPLAKQRGCATTMRGSTFRISCSVSILLRSNGVAQLGILNVKKLGIPSFNPLAKQRGCATLINKKERRGEHGFNPLAKQRGCATKLRLMTTQHGATMFQSSCEATGLRNPTARKAL